MTDPRFATNAELPLDAAPITDDDIVRAMEMLGGSFVSGLGKLWWKADAVNRERLKRAFEDYFVRYRNLLALKRSKEPS